MDAFDKLDDLIFYHFDENDDSFFAKAQCMLRSDDPQEILNLSTHFKGLGNELFKEKNFDGASENYEMAIRLCSLMLTDDVKNQTFFKTLVMSLNLNLAACFLKRHDYMRAGQICSLVLQIDPRNVKALFRRATAAFELQKPELACLDLSTAYDIDPSNEEVRNKLVQIKSLLGIPLGEKRKHARVECEGFEKVGKKTLKCKEDVSHVRPQESVTPEGTLSDLVSQQSNLKSDTHIENKLDNFVGKDMSSNPPSESEAIAPQELGVLKSGDTFIASNNHFAEPKYRFSNRRRQGSSLLITHSSYEALSHGKTLCFYNARQGSLMRIRVVPSTCKTTEIPESDMVNFQSTSLISGSICEHEVQTSEGGGGPMEYVSSIALNQREKSIDQHREEEPIFTFHAMPKHRLRASGTTLLHSKVGKCHNKHRYAKLALHNAFLSHKMFNCRLVVGFKRKIGSAIASLDSPPRKRIAHTFLCYRSANDNLLGLDIGSLVGGAESCCC